MTTGIHRIRIDVWVDYVCPYSWIHIATLDAFKAVYGAGVDIRWHPFEMRPEPFALVEPDSPARHETWAKRIYPLAFERGVSIRMPSFTTRSRLAFEVASWAADRGRFDEVHRALFSALFERGEDIGDVETLVRIATTQPDEADDLRHMLDIGWHAIRVERHKALAARLGVDGIPFTVLSRPDGGADEAERNRKGELADEADDRANEARGANGANGADDQVNGADKGEMRPVVLRGVAPLGHFHEAVHTLFPEGYAVMSAGRGPASRDEGDAAEVADTAEAATGDGTPGSATDVDACDKADHS
ncbi:DSBA oxidoreductase [Pararobbsia alpina]|uniref:DsbA family oxidoreductase n=1 Tax=Pararobbsia alpina TaxID=621374 RepID=UPI0039A43F50